MQSTGSQVVRPNNGSSATFQSGEYNKDLHQQIRASTLGNYELCSQLPAKQEQQWINALLPQPPPAAF
jgi:hypothetical protein